MVFFIIIHLLGHRVCLPYTYHRLWRVFFLDIEVGNIAVNTAAFVSYLSLSRIIFSILLRMIHMSLTSITYSEWYSYFEC